MAAIGFVAAYVGPMGNALAKANAEEVVPVTLYASGLGAAQSLDPGGRRVDGGRDLRPRQLHGLRQAEAHAPSCPGRSHVQRRRRRNPAAWTPPFISPDPGSAQAIAYGMVQARGWGDAEFACLVALWNKESGWRVNAYNRGSGAYGIPQALPGSKMGSIAPDWETNPGDADHLGPQLHPGPLRDALRRVEPLAVHRLVLSDMPRSHRRRTDSAGDESFESDARGLEARPRRAAAASGPCSP